MANVEACEPCSECESLREQLSELYVERDEALEAQRGNYAAAELLRSERDAALLKLQGFQTRMTEMGYLDLDQLATVFYRNVNWLQAIQDALKRYRVSLTKTEAEAFRDLTAAIEQPPEAQKP